MAAWIDALAAHHQIIAMIEPKSEGVEMDSDLVAPDEALVLRFQQGDLIAFDILYLKYEKQIYYLILGIVGNPQDTQDILQETFWKVYKCLFTLRLERSFKAWLTTVAKHSCIDYLRKVRSKEPPVSLDSDDVVVVVYDRGPSPEEEAIANERLREAFQQLKPQHHTILLLDAQGYTSENIARELGLKVRSVSTLLSTARRELRQLLSISVRRGKYAGRKTSNDQQYSE